MASHHQQQEVSATQQRKRPREVVIGVSEFCSILQDASNPQDVHKALSHFVRVIRRERRQALLGGRGDGDVSEEEEDEFGEDDASVLEEFRSKKQKLEEDWKEDTKGYAVPFVGTAVGVSRKRDDSGKVLRNRWPTGWLEVYLQKSPMATELLQQGLDELGSTKGRLHCELLKGSRGSRKLSASILRLFYRALGELLSASVPTFVLRRDLEEDEEGDESMEDVEGENGPPPYDKFLCQLLLKQEILTKIVRLLSEETSFGKSGSAGPLAPSLLLVLTRLAQSSKGTAREVVRSLQDVKDAIFRVLIRSPALKSTDAASPTKRFSCRSAVLHLACVLLEWQDATTLSYIASGGNRENKTNPGLLHLLCKYGLSVDAVKPATIDEKEVGLMSRLVEALWGLLPDSQVGQSPKADLDWMQHILNGVLSSTSSGCLLHLAKLARYAPAMMSHKAVLDFEQDDELSELQYLGKVSRRFVISMLVEVERSPILRTTNKRRGDERSIQGVIVKVLNELFQSDRTIAMKRLIITALQTNPSLMRLFSKSRAVASCPYVVKSNISSFLSHMAWIRLLMMEGPKIAVCFTTNGKSGNDVNQNSKWDVIMIGCKKQTFVKAIQSKHPLVVMEVLKVLIRLIERFYCFASMSSDKGAVSLLQLGFCSRIPDIPALLSLIKRFRPFGEKYASAFTPVSMLAYRALRTYARCFPGSVKRVEWSKLLPRNYEDFLASDGLIQIHLLDCLSNLVECLPNDKFCIGQPELEFVLSVMVTTRVKAVHARCRQIAGSLLAAFAGGSDQVAVTYELSLWIDGMTMEAIKDFSRAAIFSDSLSHALKAAKAWLKTKLDGNIGRLEFSSILSKAVECLNKASLAMKQLTYQVLTKLLLFSNHPLQLASLVLASSCECEELRSYCSALIDCTDFDSRATITSLEACTSALFSRTALSDTNDDGSIDVASEIKRHCHCLLVMGEEAPRHKTQDVVRVRRLLPRLSALNRVMLADVLSHPYWSCDYVDPGLLSTVRFCAWGEQLDKLERTHPIEVQEPTIGAILAFALSAKLPQRLDCELSQFVLSHCSDSDCWTSLANFWVSCQARHFALILPEVLNAFSQLAEGKEASTTKLTISLDLILREVGEQRPEIVSKAIRLLRSDAIGSACLYSLSIDPSRIKPFLHVALGCDGRLLDWFERTVSDGKHSILLESGALDQALVIVAGARTGAVNNLQSTIESRLLSLSKQTDPKSLLRCLELARMVHLRDSSCLSTMIANATKTTSISVLREVLGHIQEFGCPNEISRNLFVALCSRVPKLLKRLGTTRSDSLRVDVLKLLDVLCDMCETTKFACPDTVDTIDGVVKSCLKYGIAQAKTIPGSSLRLVGNLLDSVFDDKLDSAAMVTREKFVFLQPKAVVTMVTTHSNFVEVLSNADSSTLDTRTQMLIVLRTALLLSPTRLSLDRETWSALCGSHNAGMTPFDQEARFLILWAVGNLDEGHRPRMHDMNWTETPEAGVGDDNSEDCEWISNALDVERVRATLQQFPIYDHLQSGRLRNKSRLIGSIGALTNNDFDTDDVASSLNPNHAEDSSSMSDGSEWLQGGPDTRYSPAFVLPILGNALESLRPLKKHTMNNAAGKYGDDVVTWEGDAFVRLSMSLCSKGILSLSLASMCSRHAIMRQTALTCLTCFHQAMHSEEAKKTSSWRDRPQLCLLLNAVQRGMAIMNSKQASGNNVIRAPPLSAVFFAKAASVLTRPGDPMYGAINRYFLKLESGNGAAFTNNAEFYRLPAFVPLMCSSDEHSHHRERLWAMQTLRESFLEPSSYRAVAACHAPEMVLSTLQNTLSRSFAPFEELEAERIAGFRLFARWLMKGSRQVSNLITRLGLISWLRTFVASSGLNSTACHETFIELLEATISWQVHAFSENQYDAVLHRADLLDDRTEFEWEIGGLLFDLEQLDKHRYESTATWFREACKNSGFISS